MVKITRLELDNNNYFILDVDMLVDKMGDKFWEAVKSLRNKRLIKIIIERGT